MSSMNGDPMEVTENVSVRQAASAAGVPLVESEDEIRRATGQRMAPEEVTDAEEMQGRLTAEHWRYVSNRLFSEQSGVSFEAWELIKADRQSLLDEVAAKDRDIERLRRLLNTYGEDKDARENIDLRDKVAALTGSLTERERDWCEANDRAEALSLEVAALRSAAAGLIEQIELELGPCDGTVDSSLWPTANQMRSALAASEGTP